MKLVISEYLRTLRERDELDRLLPDLLVEMGYTPIARPQTGNRQLGVDLALRGKNPESGIDELLLLVIKQGDIGRSAWDSDVQSVRQSINEVFDAYLPSCVEPQDIGKPVRVALVTNGELKQTILQNWTGFVTQHQSKAAIDFWGVDRLADLIEKHLLDEHVFRDEDRKDLRRALALSGDADYDRRDFHRLLLRTLDLTEDGRITEGAKVGKALIKTLRIANFSAQTFASWSSNDGDARQGLQAMERALLWTWHRIQLSSEADQRDAVSAALPSLWFGYIKVIHQYYGKLQQHCYVEDGLSGYSSDGSEFSLLAFEQIGIISTIGLSQVFFQTGDDGVRDLYIANAHAVADGLENLIKNNGICSSPCLDRHSHDITLALTLMVLTGRQEAAKEWVRKLVRNVDYAFKAKMYVPISTDSLDDLVDDGGWSGGQADERLMGASWMLATLAGWSALLSENDCYGVIHRASADAEATLCLQLWHPDKDIHRHLFFKAAQHECGASEAPISLPPTAAEWREHMRVILRSEQKNIASNSSARQAGIPALELIANRHFSTPVPPYFWYSLVDILHPELATGSPSQAEAS